MAKFRSFKGRKRQPLNGSFNFMAGTRVWRVDDLILQMITLTVLTFTSEQEVFSWLPCAVSSAEVRPLLNSLCHHSIWRLEKQFSLYTGFISLSRPHLSLDEHNIE